MLVGTSGNDTFLVGAAATEIREQSGGGFDTVNATVSYTLPENVEKLRLSGSGPSTRTGNSGNNQLYGNGNANTLSGLTRR